MSDANEVRARDAPGSPALELGAARFDGERKPPPHSSVSRLEVRG
jgi:hypothetical protein